MPEIKDISEKITGIWEQMKAKNDEVIAEAKAVAGDLRTYRAEDRAELDKMNTALDGLKAQQDAIALKIERSQVVKPGEATPEEAEMGKAYKSAFFKYLRNGSKGMESEDWKALRNALPKERKALIENTAGLYLVPEDMESEIMRAVPQINTIRNYCRVRNTSRNAVKINSITEVSVGWGKLETGTTITESTPTPSQDTIYAEDLYGLVKVGEDELQDTDANLAAFLSDSFSVAIANEEAKRFAIGRGHTTYSEPDGVAVDATIIASYKNNLATPDTMIPDDLIKAMYALGTQYLNGSVLLMNRASELALRVYRPAVASGYYGAYLWQPSLIAGQPNNFDGYPIINQNDMNYASDAVKAMNVIFGNFKLGYMILDRSGISIQRLDELYSEAGMVGFKVHKRVGGGVYRPAAFYGLYNNT